MKALDFEKNFYEKTIKQLESKKINKKDLEKAQIMLQIIENEKNFYKKQACIMESLNAYERLKTILLKNNIEILGAFEDIEVITPKFCAEEIKLTDFIDSLVLPDVAKISNDIKAILIELKKFFDYTQTKNATYVFLLRDMFLCYLMGKNQDEQSFPLLFGRKMLKFFISKESHDGFDFNESDDDEIYGQFLEIMFDGATLYSNSFQKFFTYIKPRFLKLIKQHQELYNFLKDYLSSIKAKKIIVLESGLYGTMPLILKCIDSRVDFKLFTTKPEFYDIYKKKVYQKSLQKLVGLEKLKSQNEFFVFSSVRDGNVMIKLTQDKNIQMQALAEIAYFLSLC